MKVLSADQLKELDRYTIEHEPVASIDLMERAAQQCSDWLHRRFPDAAFCIIAGQGNNGGDGLAIARQLGACGHEVQVRICKIGQPSDDFRINLDRLRQTGIQIDPLAPGQQPAIPGGSVAVDAIFGYGLNRPVASPWDQVITAINAAPNMVISIDLPSGLFADRPTEGPCIAATHTLTFETPKLAFFMPENHRYVGAWHVLPIGLHRAKYAELEAAWETVDISTAASLLKPRDKFDHKGVYGHAFLVVGSFGKIGAAILASQAVLRSGAGLLTVHVPRKAYEIMQIAVPEAMVQVDRHDENFSGLDHTPSFSALGIGCGIGVNTCTAAGMRQLLSTLDRPIVLDADGLNVIALHPELIELIPRGSVLTPHFKEFERLFGVSAHHFERLERLTAMARQYELVIVLKGAHSAIALPTGPCFFNSTGNPGMATAGSGDVLTGVITGLLAQGYSPRESALLGVFVHGLAGDIGAQALGQEALVAGDIVQFLGAAFNKLRSPSTNLIHD
ncbi:MAG: NAD(P)H-hydrate dehydratase [Saprospiraceae bacterium]|nr:NAD(P)H-hydrate dehydratase [Saprospiraceae bacterium]